jgi:hypothetical protein
LKFNCLSASCHSIETFSCLREISRIPTKLKIVTGIYVLQVDRVKFKQNVERGICELCGEAEENLTHFLLTCKCLEFVRKPIIEDLISSCSKEIARFSYKETKFDILQLIVDPFVYIGNFKEEEVHTVIHSIILLIEPKCRRKSIYRQCCHIVRGCLLRHSVYYFRF